MSTSLVLTFCSGYSFPVYERFVGSLFDTGFSGKLVMFIALSDTKVVEPLKSAYGDKLDVQICQWFFHPQTYRYFLYRNYLENVERADKIFLCDGRDVMFQKNIFAYPLDTSACLWLFEEDGSIGQDIFNRTWIQQIDPSSLPALAHKRILCSGTTLATLQGARVYLDTMISLVTDIFLRKGRTAELGAIDQGLHNYMAYHQSILASRLADYHLKFAILTNDDNLVNNVGISSHHVLTDDGKVANRSGEVSYCVHQYDRLGQKLREQMTRFSKYNFLE